MSARVSKRKIRKIEPRNTAMLDDVERRADNDGRNFVGFEMTRHEAQGLVTDGTQRREDGRVRAIPADTGQNLRRVLVYGFSLAVFRRHAVKTRGQAFEDSLSRQFAS